MKQLGCAALLSFVLATNAAAQADRRGAINGTVTNSSGASIANITVQLENIDNGAKQQTTTDASGKYRFDAVEPGRYRMSTTQNGVTSTPSNEVDVALATVSVVALTVAEPTRTVSTTSPVTDATPASPVANMVGPQIQNGFTTRDIQNLPLSNYLARNGAQFGAYNLSLLDAGVASNGGIGPGRGPIVGGQRPAANNFYINGMDNDNRANLGQLAGLSGEQTSEFVAYQNQFPPEYGHTTGGEFNSILREANNRFHGELFEYWQNTNLNAIDQSVARQGFLNNPRYDQNRLGMNLGIPLKQDKLFFFGDFEYIPLGFDATPITPVYAPTAAGFAALAGMPNISTTNLNLLQNVLAAAPTASRFEAINGAQIPVGISPLFGRAFQNQYNWVGALDWKMRQSDTLQTRYVQDQLQGSSNGAAIPAFFSPLKTRSLMASVSEIHDFANSSINELRLGYNRYDQIFGNSALSFPGLNGGGFPYISLEDLNLQLGQNLLGPQTAALGTFSLADNYHATKGRHTLRFGYDGRRVIGPETFSQFGAGSYIYSSLEGFLNDLPPDVSGMRTAGNLSYATNQWDSYGYVKDEMRLRPNLEVDLGVRYEFVTLPAYLQAQSRNAIANVPGVLTFGEPDVQKTGFAPTVGFAFSPGAKRNSVFRAGFGMNYDATAYTALAPLFAPGVATTFSTAGLSPVPGFFGTGNFFSPAFGAGLSPQALTTSYIPDQRLPYTMQWNASWQQAMGHGFVLELRYLGVRGVHLPAASFLNQSPVVTASQNLPLYFSQPSQATLDSLTTTLAGLQAASNPLAAAGFTSPILQMTTSGNSIYNGLGVQATRRFSQAFQFTAGYTWSHLIDDVSSPLIAPVPSLGFVDQRTFRDSSLYDHRQRGTLAWVTDIGAIGSGQPGWYRGIVHNLSFSGTYIYETPAPLPVLGDFNAGFAGALGAPGIFVNPTGSPAIGSGVTPLTNSLGDTVAYLANNPSARFISAAPGMFADRGRLAFPGLRPINDFDLSAMKGFAIRDRFNFEIRADAFNVLNHPQFTPGEVNNIGLPPQSQTFTYLMAGAAGFGNPEAALSSHPRMLQLALRLIF